MINLTGLDLKLNIGEEGERKTAHVPMGCLLDSPIVKCFQYVIIYLNAIWSIFGSEIYILKNCELSPSCLDQKMLKINLKNNRTSPCNMDILNLNLYTFMISAGDGDTEELKVAEDDTWD